MSGGRRGPLDPRNWEFNVVGKPEADGSLLLPSTRFFRYTGYNHISPSDYIKQAVQGKYINPLTNQVVSTPVLLEADHLLPAKAIANMPGFQKLNRSSQLLILNDMNNFQGLPRTFNASKQHKPLSEWTEYKGMSLHPDYIRNNEVLEPILKQYLQSKIDFLLSVQAK